MKKLHSRAAAVAVVFGLSACTAGTSTNENMTLMNGPAPQVDITTVYDQALSCVADELVDRAKFQLAVGEIADSTGKFSSEGNGYYLTQAAGDILQTSLVRAQPTHVVNRRNTKVMELEMKLGRTLKWVGSDAHATGSINTLDFVPGGGFEVSVAGWGGKARQYRMVVGMDLFLTETISSKVIASSSINKQIVALDYGMGVGKFFGTTLVTMNIGEQQREAVGFATREMIKLGTIELLSDLYKDDFTACRAIIDSVEGVEDAETATTEPKAAPEADKEAEIKNPESSTVLAEKATPVSWDELEIQASRVENDSSDYNTK